jgi:hypothetical protein
MIGGNMAMTASPRRPVFPIWMVSGLLARRDALYSVLNIAKDGCGWLLGSSLLVSYPMLQHHGVDNVRHGSMLGSPSVQAESKITLSSGDLRDTCLVIHDMSQNITGRAVDKEQEICDSLEMG